MLRRTFLLLMGIALARVLADYFAIAENRANFANLVQQLWQKLITYLEQREGGSAQKPLPDAPLPPTSTTQKPLPDAPQPSPTPKPSKPSPAAKVTPKKGRPVEVIQKAVNGVPFYQTTIDLTDPEIFMTIGLANNAAQANSATATSGDEPFENMVNRYKAAVVANGTFFSKDEQKRVMGNMVAGGKFLKYSRWENFGTTLGIKAGNELEMITARAEGKPEWNQHWFSLTCGPRLLKQGKIWLAPKKEGFADPHVLDVGYRTAIGYAADKKRLFLVSFLAALSLQEEAELMKAIGCAEAMNLDGGASEALAYNGNILIPPGRNLTNVIVIYDTNSPAPTDLQASWQRFQNGDRPFYPL